VRNPRRYRAPIPCAHRPRRRAGFSLIELMMASLIMLAIAAAAFELLARAHRSANTQADMQEATDNARLAMDIVARYVRHAANDPFHAGFAGITIISNTEMRLRSDLTGSAGTADPDMGDADGDTDDAHENVTIRHDPADRSIEIIHEGGSAQAIAGSIAALDLRYFDAEGGETTTGSEVRRIRISITGVGNLPDPYTGLRFNMQIVSDIRVATRR
jgi:prepilin-type N-terminal cleavage/methylation domain-containing protein